MPPETARQQEPVSRSAILAVVLIYAVFAACWILLSDKLMQIIFSDPGQIILVSVIKGWLFVVVTSLLLYELMLRRVGSNAATKVFPADSHLQGWPFILLAIVILALTGTGIFTHISQHKETEVIRLQAIADMKTQQIVDWLKERQSDTEIIQTSHFFAELYRNWQGSGDLHSGKQLQTRLEQLLKNRGLSAVTLLSPESKRLWGSSAAPLKLDDNELAVARSVATDGKTQLVEPYLDATGKVRMDFVVPLSAIPGLTPLVIINIDLSANLIPILKSWPIPSISGESQLFRQQDDQVFIINETQHKNIKAAKPPLAASAEKLLTTRVLQGLTSPDGLLEGDDYRGIPSIGVVRAIAGTDWYLIVKLDRDELYAEAVRDVAWISLVSLLVVFLVGATFYLLKQGQQLALAEAVQKSQAERLNTLNLLNAVANSSGDAIFAKDLEGRFILFNRAASHFVGKPVEEVLGFDERSIFPAEQADMLIDTDHKIVTERTTHTQEETLDTPHGKKTFFTTKGPLYDGHGNIIGIFGIARDITERKQIELSLNASELSYRSLFDNMIHGYAHCLVLYEQGEPCDFVYLQVNKAFETLTGLKNVVGYKVSEVIPGIRETDSELFDIYARVALGGQPEQFETYVNALQMWFLISVYCPKKEHFVALFDVITERKQTELALLKSEELKHAILDSINAHIAVLDHHGVIITVNQPWQHFAEENALYPDASGTNVGVGANYLDICRQSSGFSSEGALAAYNGIQAVIDRQLPDFNLEYPCHSPTQKRWFSMTVNPLRDGERGVVIVHIDITGRKLQELALGASESRFRALVEQSLAGIYIIQDGFFKYVNPGFVAIFGYGSPEDMVNCMPIADLVCPEDRKQVAENISLRVAGTVVDTNYTFAGLHRNGSRIFVEVQGRALDYQGRPGIIGFAIDVTARKAAEESLLRQTEELAKRNAELERFNNAMVGRELKMVELKQEINTLSCRLGQEPPYPLAFLDVDPAQDQGN